MVYEYRTKGLFKVSAQIAGEECARLEKSAVGLSPKTLLDASRDVNAPLHGEFEWDDNIAAENWRTKQASAIIRNVYVVAQEVEDKPAVRAFVRVSSETQPSRYNNIHTVLSRPDMRDVLMEQAKKDCMSFERKYSVLEDCAAIIGAMHTFVDGW